MPINILDGQLMSWYLATWLDWTRKHEQWSIALQAYLRLPHPCLEQNQDTSPKVRPLPVWPPAHPSKLPKSKASFPFSYSAHQDAAAVFWDSCSDHFSLALEPDRRGDLCVHPCCRRNAPRESEETVRSLSRTLDSLGPL